MVGPLSPLTQLIAVQGPQPLVGSKGKALAGFGAEPQGFLPAPDDPAKCGSYCCEPL